jgi:hypothetical protein
MESVQIISESQGYVLVKDGQKLMSEFGNVPLWFETESEAETFVKDQLTQDDTLGTVIQSLMSNVHFETGEPMLINAETIAETINSDALFYPYPGPERIEQELYFSPIRSCLNEINFHWQDLDISSPYNIDDAKPVLAIVESLSLKDKAKLLFFMINTSSLFFAPLGYLKGSITEPEFLEAWLTNSGQSTNPKSKAYAKLKGVLDRLNGLS